MKSDSRSSSQRQRAPLDAEQLYFLGRLETYRSPRTSGGTGAASCGATAAGVGRSGSATFGRPGPGPGPAALGYRLRSRGGGGTGGTAAGEGGSPGAAGFGGALLPEAAALEAALSEVAANPLAPDEVAPGLSKACVCLVLAVPGGGGGAFYWQAYSQRAGCACTAWCRVREPAGQGLAPRFGIPLVLTPSFSSATPRRVHRGGEAAPSRAPGRAVDLGQGEPAAALRGGSCGQGSGGGASRGRW